MAPRDGKMDPIAPGFIRNVISGVRTVVSGVNPNNWFGPSQPMAPQAPEEVKGPVHPLVRVHPVTGRRALYLGRRRTWPSNYIVGMPNAESEALLDRLWAHATQPRYAWTHKWRVGDIVLWDNRCCMHYRTEIDTAYRRVMHRTTIAGEPVIAG